MNDLFRSLQLPRLLCRVQENSTCVHSQFGPVISPELWHCRPENRKIVSVLCAECFRALSSSSYLEQFWIIKRMMTLSAQSTKHRGGKHLWMVAKYRAHGQDVFPSYLRMSLRGRIGQAQWSNAQVCSRGRSGHSHYFLPWNLRFVECLVIVNGILPIGLLAPG
jgi:hypothetical protein